MLMPDDYLSMVARKRPEIAVRNAASFGKFLHGFVHGVDLSLPKIVMACGVMEFSDISMGARASARPLLSLIARLIDLEIGSRNAQFHLWKRSKSGSMYAASLPRLGTAFLLHTYSSDEVMNPSRYLDGLGLVCWTSWVSRHGVLRLCHVDLQRIVGKTVFPYPPYPPFPPGSRAVIGIPERPAAAHGDLNLYEAVLAENIARAMDLSIRLGYYESDSVTMGLVDALRRYHDLISRELPASWIK